ncbi:MAG: hypothetical protein FWG02_05430 [Holophagaceae bacterium]|nr:hypothetical protein [Holophagaceae bacterium]
MKWLKSLFFGTLIFAVANLFTPTLTAKQADDNCEHFFTLSGPYICYLVGKCYFAHMNDWEANVDEGISVMFVGPFSFDQYYCVYYCIYHG